MKPGAMSHLLLRWTSFIVSVGILLTFVSGVTAEMVLQSAPPPLPSSFYGTIEIDGTPSDEMTISVLIDGVVYAQTAVIQQDGQLVYTIKVPGDNPSTESVEGGNPGDVLVFHINGNDTGQTAVWQSGVNTQLDLSLSTITDTNSASSPPDPTNTPWFIIPIALILLLMGIGVWQWRRRQHQQQG